MNKKKYSVSLLIEKHSIKKTIFLCLIVRFFEREIADDNIQRLVFPPQKRFLTHINVVSSTFVLRVRVSMIN